MQKIPITEARNQFMKLPDRITEERVLAVTKRNKEVMAVMSWDLYEGLVETLEVLSDPEMMGELKKALEDIKAGKTYTLAKARERLGL